MFYHLLYPLHSVVPGFNVFRYLTFRTAYAILTGLLISLILGPWVIRRLRRHQIGEMIREDGPKSHQNKAGTPTMGGLLILMALSIPTVLWSDLTNRYVWLLLSATFAFGAIGFVDDWLKLARLRRQGLRIGEKLLAQTVVAGGLASCMYFYPEDPSVATQITVPFFKEVTPDIGVWYIPLIVFIMVGTCNAVNLTDGLDGLAAGPLIIATFAFTVIAYVAGHAQFANYLLSYSCRWWAASLSSKPCQCCCKSSHSNSQASASFGWPRCIITLKRKVGRNQKSLCASGSSLLSWLSSV
jgi:phospho-N-acetylmuramoyl-pentapeptide-transferase